MQLRQGKELAYLDSKPTSVRLNLNQFDETLKALAANYRAYAPVRLAGRGRFSDSDSIRYAEIHSVNQIVTSEKSHFSPKEIVFPITQTLFYLAESGYQEPSVDDHGIIIFLRSCDIHAMKRLDTMFLENGDRKDTYYEKLRSSVKFVLLECRESFENCFCVSMGTNTTDEYAMAVRIGEDEVFAQIRDSVFLNALPASVEGVEFSPSFVASNEVSVNLPEKEVLTRAIRENAFFDHSMWDDYTNRCIACGRCNTHCPTCSCFTTYDIHYDDNPNSGERRRVWASCHIDRFTDMAGGCYYREDNGSRMRFKTMHKVYDYYLRFGEHMCVGCGRCDDACPEFISYSNCINLVSAALEEGSR